MRAARAAWPARPSPRPNETLSSLVSRAALLNGMAPRSLFRVLERQEGFSRAVTVHLGTTRRRQTAWIDFSVSRELLSELARALNAEAESLERCRILPERKRLQGSVGHIAEIAPTLLRPDPISVEGARRSRQAVDGYVAFCPLCLAEDPSISQWRRLTLARVCLAHGTLLLDRCPNCGSAWRPHLSRRLQSFAACQICGTDLRRLRTRPATQHDAWFQWRLEHLARREVERIVRSNAEQTRGAERQLRILVSEIIRAAERHRDCENPRGLSFLPPKMHSQRSQKSRHQNDGVTTLLTESH